MTSNLPIYPEYCHELSPTIKRWCPLRATDVHALESRGVFSNGKEVFYHGNHPIKWVRLTGVVVAVDDFYGRKVYTLDDSSGMCIECTCPTPEPPKPASLLTGDNPVAVVAKQEPVAKAENAATEGPTVTNPRIPWEEMDVGVVVKVKGGIKQFRDQMQVEIIKIEVLRSTDQEVRCWDEVTTFRSEVLTVPWVVSEEMEEKYKRRAEKELRRQRKGKRGKEDARHGRRGEDQSGKAQGRHDVKMAASTEKFERARKSTVDDRDAALREVSDGLRWQRKEQERSDRHQQKNDQRRRAGGAERFDASDKANVPSLAARKRGAGKYDA